MRRALERGGYTEALTLLRADPDGRVTLELVPSMSAIERGPLLLRAERALKSDLDAGLQVFLRPLQDRNMLRRLRGASVKESR